MPLKTPICDFGQAAKSFELKSTNNKIIKLCRTKYLFILNFIKNE